MTTLRLCAEEHGIGYRARAVHTVACGPTTRSDGGQDKRETRERARAHLRQRAGDRATGEQRGGRVDAEVHGGEGEAEEGDAGEEHDDGRRERCGAPAEVLEHELAGQHERDRHVTCVQTRASVERAVCTLWRDMTEHAHCSSVHLTLPVKRQLVWVQSVYIASSAIARAQRLTREKQTKERVAVLEGAPV